MSSKDKIKKLGKLKKRNKNIIREISLEDISRSNSFPLKKPMKED